MITKFFGSYDELTEEHARLFLHHLPVRRRCSGSKATIYQLAAVAPFFALVKNRQEPIHTQSSILGLSGGQREQDLGLERTSRGEEMRVDLRMFPHAFRVNP